MMKIEIFITESDKVMVDRSFIVKNGKAPEIDMQELVDTAVGYLKEDAAKQHAADFTGLSPHDEALRDVGKWERPNEGDSHVGGGEPF